MNQKEEKKEHKRRGSVRKKEKKKVFGTLWQSTCSLYRQQHIQEGMSHSFLIMKLNNLAQKMSQWQQTPSFSASFMQWKFDLYWRVWETYVFFLKT